MTRVEHGLAPFMAGIGLGSIGSGFSGNFMVLRIVFRENYEYSNEYQSVDIKVLLHQNIQCINILAQAPDTQYVGYVCMTMSRTKVTYNQFYNCYCSTEQQGEKRN